MSLKDPQTGCPAWTCGGTNNTCSGFTAATRDGIFASIIAFGTNQTPTNYSNQPFTPAVQSYDAINPVSTNIPPNLGWRIFGHAKNGAGPFYQLPITAASNSTQPALNTSRGISLPALNTDYYLRLERLSPTACMISVYTDSAMQNHVPGSPQCFRIEEGIQDLNTIQNFTHQSGSFFRSITGTMDDLRVFDNFNLCPHRSPPCDVSPSPTATPRLTPTPSPTATPSPPPDPCCPPWNATVLSDMLVPDFSGGINAPYTLHFVPTAAFNSQMQAYIDYLHSRNPLITQITIDWRLHDQGPGTNCTNCAPPYGQQIGPTVWTQWTQGGNGTPTFTSPGFFNLPTYPMVKGHCYMIHTGIYLEGGQRFFPDTCAVAEVCVQWQVSQRSSEPPALEMKAGKKVLKRIPITKDKTQ